MSETANPEAAPAGSKPKVFVGIPVPEHVLAWIDAACEVQQAGGAGRAGIDEITAALPGVVGVLTSNQVKLSNELLAAHPHLLVVSNMGVGYDNIDIPWATSHGLLVCNTPDVLTDAVADLTYGFVLALARRIVEARDFVAAGSWRPGAQMPFGTDLRGKTLGLLGFGRIGHAVARRAAGFGLRPLYYDPVRDAKAEDDGLAEYAPEERVLAEADFLTVHVFLDGSTRGLMRAEKFAKMKPSAFFINTSRGPVVNQADLAAALNEGRIAGAALDVFEQEPIPANDPILSAPNLLLSPHMASATTETRLAMQERCARNLIAAVTGGIPEAMVNPEALQVRAGR